MATQDATPRPLRPIFVWTLVLIAGPIVALFSVGMVTDLHGPVQIGARVSYGVGAFLAPSILVKRARRRGVGLAVAISAALGLASIVLFLHLVILNAAGSGLLAAALCGAVAGAAVSVGAVVSAWPRIPPRPDLP